MRTIYLSPAEIRILDRHIAGSGGFQSLLRRLRRRVIRATGQLDLDASDLERIPRYAFDYRNGGWEDRLIAIFSRTLGPHLGRVPTAAGAFGVHRWR